jgi:hypothetical protein
MLTSRAYHAILVAASVLASGCATERVTEAARLHPASVSPANAFQLSGQYGMVLTGLTNFDEATFRRLIGYAKSAGVTFAREQISWPQIQTAAHEWNQPVFDKHKAVFRALLDSGITPFVTLYGTASWACYNPDDCNDPGEEKRAPDNYPAWQDFVREVVDSFPNVQYWGIWNEPSAAAALTPRPGSTRLADYKELVIYASAVIRPRGKLLLAPEDGNLSFLVDVVGSYYPYIDIVSTHGYSLSWENHDLMRQIEVELRNRGIYRDLWLTEQGNSINNSKPNDGQQASHLTSVYRRMNGRSVPSWKKTFQFHLFHNWWNGPNENFELIETAIDNPVFRPAYGCFKSLATGGSLASACLYETECDTYMLSLKPQCSLNSDIFGAPTTRPGAVCVWSATAAGISPPMTYTWYVNGGQVGTGASLTYQSPGGAFQLSLTVRDAAGRTSTTNRLVPVGSNEPMCSPN